MQVLRLVEEARVSIRKALNSKRRSSKGVSRMGSTSRERGVRERVWVRRRCLMLRWPWAMEMQRGLLGIWGMHEVGRGRGLMGWSGEGVRHAALFWQWRLTAEGDGCAHVAMPLFMPLFIYFEWLVHRWSMRTTSSKERA